LNAQEPRAVAEQTPLDKVLALRPTNVVTRLGHDSRLPLLNLRDLLAALEGGQAGLACFPAYALASVGGLLRASRDEDAIVGLACPWPQRDRDAPSRFIEALHDATEAVRHRKPLFLQAGPIRLSGRGDDEVVYQFIQAGFTAVSLDAHGLGAAEARSAYRAAAQPILERELSLELAAPLDELGRLAPALARELLEPLAADGVLVQSLRVPIRTFALEESPREAWQLDSAELKEVVDIAREHGAAVAVEDDGAATQTLAPVLLEGGARKVDPLEIMARLVLAALSSDRLAQLKQDAGADGVHIRERLAGPGWEQGGMDERATLRVEALTWATASDLLVALNARGTASHAVGFLARGGRY
jgi:hypothetical protein